MLRSKAHLEAVKIGEESAKGSLSMFGSLDDVCCQVIIQVLYATAVSLSSFRCYSPFSPCSLYLLCCSMRRACSTFSLWRGGDREVRILPTSNFLDGEAGRLLSCSGLLVEESGGEFCYLGSCLREKGATERDEVDVLMERLVDWLLRRDDEGNVGWDALLWLDESGRRSGIGKGMGGLKKEQDGGEEEVEKRLSRG